MGVVTVPELKNYLSGLNITDIQEQSLEAIIGGVQSELERHLNRPVQRQRVMEEADADHAGNVYLGVTPIVEVYGIYPVGMDGGPDLVHPIGNSANPMGSIFRRNSNYLKLGGVVGGAVYVDYLGGINGDQNPGLKLAIMRVAAREYMHNHGDSMSLSNTESRPESDPTPTPKGWTADELRQFDRLRRRTVL